MFDVITNYCPIKYIDLHTLTSVPAGSSHPDSVVGVYGVLIQITVVVIVVAGIVQHGHGTLGQTPAVACVLAPQLPAALALLVVVAAAVVLCSEVDALVVVLVVIVADFVGGDGSTSMLARFR